MHVHDLLQLDSPDPGGCATGHEGRPASAGEKPHTAGCPAVDALVALAAGGPADDAALDAALRACGLPPSGPYRVVVATTVGEERGPHGECAGGGAAVLPR